MSPECVKRVGKSVHLSTWLVAPHSYRAEALAGVYKANKLILTISLLYSLIVTAFQKTSLQVCLEALRKFYARMCDNYKHFCEFKFVKKLRIANENTNHVKKI